MTALSLWFLFCANISRASPAIVVEYMDGGGGRQVGNHMYRNARPDGLTIGAFSSAVISTEYPARERGHVRYR